VRSGRQPGQPIFLDTKSMVPKALPRKIGQHGRQFLNAMNPLSVGLTRLKLMR
jgi:hypothetical protein